MSFSLCRSRVLEALDAGLRSNEHLLPLAAVEDSSAYGVEVASVNGHTRSVLGPKSTKLCHCGHWPLAHMVKGADMASRI